MAHPVWPEGLPYKPRQLPGNAEWNVTPKLAPISTTFEQGNIRQRARAGDDVQVIEQTLRFSAAEFATWQAFFLASGNGRITMPVCLDGDTYAPRTVQIVGIPKESSDGLKFAVPMTLRVYPV